MSNMLAHRPTDVVVESTEGTNTMVKWRGGGRGGSGGWGKGSSCPDATRGEVHNPTVTRTTLVSLVAAGDEQVRAN